ncbi:Uncharacterized conserved protein [Gillisia sp. Hel1_33_143]|uniref:esterase-like activity of phytase family protein n=1 Tax=Gillisia sp. Hel1_33_143 TaxID=1336796 RepID=UPI00087C6D3E|nr:esterase-like activity of phytase family protein [Gillisia sp. Hel1_33_143]SDS37343.1 Uncharacterized conserved protein [Gillisia sp. Hel1_33_143]
MKNYLLLALFSILILTSCGTSKKISTENITLKFLDDYIIPADLEIDGTKVGGLSGIDYHNDNFYLVCDHPGNPRFYVASVELSNTKIDTVIFKNTVMIQQDANFFKDNTLDLEAIRYNTTSGNLWLTSEGSIKKNKNPSIFSVTPEGKYISNFEMPDYFKVDGCQKPRNNGVFEGLSESFDKKGYWAGMELPLEKDGPKPKLYPTNSLVRITNFNLVSKKPVSQFAFKLESISKIPWKYFAVNGLTDLIEYAPNKFLVLERAFSAGHGSTGNTVRIFDVDASSASNTLLIQNIKHAKINTATKKLVFNFDSIKDKLTENIIDNIEGMSFGPKLPNGNSTLILISDNNFNSMGKQLSQIILLEVDLK